MEKDKRYSIAKKLFSAGLIQWFSEVLDIIPKTTFGHDLGIHHVSFAKLVQNPKRSTLEQIYQIVALMEVDRWEAVKMIHIGNEKGRKTK